ncbi:MAG: succinylglutamate desuccinylase/aspartoacylase family protein [Anaerolineae bacterium]|nr:succinylglutamate desuccinylase/aspartoacylase family protein [Anaerolineae bacterium]
MNPSIQIGTACSQPGAITYGTFDAVPLPTGGADTFPIVIAQGRGGARPVLWVTGTIHGGEFDGLATIHQLITPELVERLSGTVIAVPTLNPAGLRTHERSPYYLYGRDPNRLFPAMSGTLDENDTAFPSALEMAYTRLFERIAATGDYLIDLHNYGAISIPFAFRDPVFYHDGHDKGLARKLQETVGAMLKAMGLTIVNEYVSAQYIKLHLHRSVSGAALNTARIPAVTVELGGQRVVNVRHVHAAAAGIRNVMRWAGMLPDPFEPIREVPVIDLGHPVRRIQHPRVTTACIVQHLVQPGERVERGQPVARMVDVFGRPVEPDDGVLRTELDGFVLGLYPSLAHYPNEAVLGLAVRDDNNLVQPIPRA